MNGISKLSQKPSNIKRSSWPFEKQDFPDRKKIISNPIFFQTIFVTTQVGLLLYMTAHSDLKSQDIYIILTVRGVQIPPINQGRQINMVTEKNKEEQPSWLTEGSTVSNEVSDYYDRWA